MLLADNLYAKLLTTMMHNTGLSSSKTPTTFLSDVPLRQVAESRGYTVTWNKADGSPPPSPRAMSPIPLPLRAMNVSPALVKPLS